MINALNLLWIVPVCIVAGAVALAFFVGATQNNKEYEVYQQGILEGKRMMSNKMDPTVSQTLGELLNRKFNNDFNLFKEFTGGLIYGIEETEQMSMLFIDTIEDIHTYNKCQILGVNYEGQYQRPIIKVEV